MSCILAAVFIAIIPFVQSIMVFAVVWTLYRLFASASSFAFDSIVSLNAEERLRGKISGTYLASCNFGSFLGALASGGAFQIISVNLPFFISSGVFIFCFVIMSFVLKSKEIMA